MNTERDLLQRARELILQKKYAEARAILLGLPGNETARQWLAKLDEIDPFGAAPASPAPNPAPIPAPLRAMPAASAPMPAANTALLVHSLKYVVSGLVFVMALLMIIGFFAFPWLDLGNMFGMGALFKDLDIDKGPMHVTAMELWMGRNSGEPFTLDMTRTLEGSGGGFADVRLLDRFLILIPIGAIVLMWLAWMHGTDALPPLPALVAMTIIALLLLIFPFAWEELSKDDWNNSFSQAMGPLGLGEYDTSGAAELGMDAELFGSVYGTMVGSMMVEFFVQTYSTDEQAILGGIAFVTALFGLLAFVAAQSARPGAGRATTGRF